MISVYYGEYASEHFTQEIRKADQLIREHKEVGDIAVLTGSEVFIRRICQAIRCGKLSGSDVSLYVGDRRFLIDVKGQFIDPWPDDLFEITFNLLFHDYDEIDVQSSNDLVPSSSPSPPTTAVPDSWDVLKRVYELFADFTRLGVFDEVVGRSDATHPDVINALCDDVEALVLQQEKADTTNQK